MGGRKVYIVYSESCGTEVILGVFGSKKRAKEEAGDYGTVKVATVDEVAEPSILED